MNNYLPEGYLISSAENRELTSSIRGLEKARDQEKILEATAVMCDSDLNITVDLCGIKGIIPKSEALLAEENQKDIAIITRIGKPVCFKVTDFTRDAEGKTVVMLSRKSAQAECRENFIMKLTAGDVIDAKVTHMEKFGAFVDIGCGLISLMTIDSISVSRISHPKDRFTVGMNLKAVVKSIDYETGRVYVSQKELLGTWLENASEFSVGQTVAGTIRSVEDYGVFIELSPNLTGLAEARDDLTVGQSAAVYIKNIIPDRMKIKLVIIDAAKKDSALKSPKYYYPSGNHISHWRYSPPGCGKVIESIFN